MKTMKVCEEESTVLRTMCFADTLDASNKLKVFSHGHLTQALYLNKMRNVLVDLICTKALRQITSGLSKIN